YPTTAEHNTQLLLPLPVHDPPRPARPALSLHDALPISRPSRSPCAALPPCEPPHPPDRSAEGAKRGGRRALVACSYANAYLISEIGRAPSELQSRFDLVCRLPLEEKKYRRSSRCPRQGS